MKVTKKQAAATRERILDEAAKLFRERGFSGIGVADLMRRIGLTHGGFYGHFGSKEELMAEACQRAVSTMLEEWTRLADAAPAKPLAAITAPIFRPDTVISRALDVLWRPLVRKFHVRRRRCAMSSLNVWAAFLSSWRFTPGKTAAAKHKKAIVTFASMVGALVIARAVNNPKLSEEILEVVSASVAGSA